MALYGPPVSKSRTDRAGTAEDGRGTAERGSQMPGLTGMVRGSSGRGERHE